MYKIYYKSYTGFVFEELLEQLFRENGFKPTQSRELDDIYKLDMVVKHPDYEFDVGIQCKSITYLKVDKWVKYEHQTAHKEAIYDGQCFTVIYMYHNDDMNVVDENEKVLNVEEIIEMIMRNILKFSHKKILICRQTV